MSGLFDRDEYGRTSLFDAAARGDTEMVRKLIFTLPGTGIFPSRLSLLVIQENSGLTAADVAEQEGHDEIAQLLRREVSRMKYSE